MFISMFTSARSYVHPHTLATLKSTFNNVITLLDEDPSQWISIHDSINTAHRCLNCAFTHTNDGNNPESASGDVLDSELATGQTSSISVTFGVHGLYKSTHYFCDDCYVSLSTDLYDLKINLRDRKLTKLSAVAITTSVSLLQVQHSLTCSCCCTNDSMYIVEYIARRTSQSQLRYHSMLATTTAICIKCTKRIIAREYFIVHTLITSHLHRDLLSMLCELFVRTKMDC